MMPTIAVDERFPSGLEESISDLGSRISNLGLRIWGRSLAGSFTCGFCINKVESEIHNPKSNIQNSLTVSDSSRREVSRSGKAYIRGTFQDAHRKLMEENSGHRATSAVDGECPHHARLMVLLCFPETVCLYTDQS